MHSVLIVIGLIALGVSNAHAHRCDASGVFASANPTGQLNCEAGGAPAECEYPPFVDDGGRVADYTGVDDGLPWLPGDAPSDEMFRVTIPFTGVSTDAVCNDGSPAVMWVRRALTDVDEDKWLIVLEGGGAGFDAVAGVLGDGMWDRWTGGDGEALSWVRKTSSDFRDGNGNPGADCVVDLPLSLRARGIFDSSRTAFANWNWVFVNYCSSDVWGGTSPEHEMPGSGSWVDAGIAKAGFKMDFSGHIILKAVLQLLRQNVGWGTDEFPDYEMPDIDDAATVLVAGESAGSNGVLNNVDWIADTLETHNPGVEVLASMGAEYKAPMGVPGDPWFLDRDGDLFSDVQAGLELQWLQLGEIGGFADASCTSTLGDWRCLHTHSALPEIATPHFIKQDMTDNKLSSAYTSPNDFALGVEQHFLDNDAAGTPPYFGPRCGDHETLTSDNHFLRALRRFEFSGGAPIPPALSSINYNEAIRRFVDANTLDTQIYNGKIVNENGVDYIWLSNCVGAWSAVAGNGNGNGASQAAQSVNKNGRPVHIGRRSRR